MIWFWWDDNPDQIRFSHHSLVNIKNDDTLLTVSLMAMYQIVSILRCFAQLNTLCLKINWYKKDHRLITLRLLNPSNHLPLLRSHSSQQVCFCFQSKVHLFLGHAMFTASKCTRNHLRQEKVGLSNTDLTYAHVTIYFRRKYVYQIQI